jgi:hypothetical protein
MSQRIQELIKEVKTDTSGRWVDTSELPVLVEKIVRECTDVVKHTPKHCAHTTYDLGIVNCTIEKSVDEILGHFNLAKQY